MDQDTRPGTLRRDAWSRTAALTAHDLEGRLGEFEEGRWILEVDGPPDLGVDVYHYEYNTLDGRGEAVTASGALMVPRRGDGAGAGPLPIVVGLHGTMPDKPYNLADLSGANPASPRAIALAATYAAHGYIVVAPNYTGLDTSTATHQSYIDARQQSHDVLDALAAARDLLPRVSARESGRLFLAGYSQGGWLAMATHREMEARGMAPTASAPMSGPYALTVVVDDVFNGRPVQGSTIYFPLAIRAFQEAYGDVYAAPSDVYRPAIADDVATLLPNETSHFVLIADGRLPATAVFSNRAAAPADVSSHVRDILEHQSPARLPERFAPIYATGFGDAPLFNEAFRIAYLTDAEAHPDGAFPVYVSGEPPAASGHGLRRAVIRNDLRGWTPTAPMLLCGGQGDAATPLRHGGELMMRYWSDPARSPAPGVVGLLDFESPVSPGDPFADLKSHFQSWKGGFLEQAVMPAWADAYHQFLLPRYCYLAARRFFDPMR